MFCLPSALFVSQDQQHDAARKRNTSNDRRQRDRFCLVGSHLNRTEIDDLFPGRVGDALIRKRDNAYYDKDDAYQRVFFHFAPPFCCQPGCFRIVAGLRTSRQPATIQSLFGLLDGHLVLYALHTLYVVDEFADQVFFGCIPGLATQRDHAIVRLDFGVDGTGRAMEQQRHLDLGGDGRVINLFTCRIVSLFQSLNHSILGTPYLISLLFLWAGFLAL